ncbi:DUF2933 domain-containing protein [Burkholderia pseudomallei]|uniref:DUF2933 domain-containing protein n=1 Tax=Burkholderia pseudomallei TaxID=28450 RepID=UPI000F085CB6|nr:DUF2933 domain-containing protein [Burkholderia pseudomallei]VCJ27933.1 Protein of uncharacterised function (DUF2933) [Burkholderia pseudomallei]VCJ28986.1 Protein of uncharacterised function (DUF2933) [Burkholderia pseudomallei]
MEHGQHDRKSGGFGLSRTNLVLIAFIAIGGFYLVTEHRAHLLGWLPFLIFLACPLMHLFMHHGHGGGESDDGQGEGKPDQGRTTGSHHH